MEMLSHDLNLRLSDWEGRAVPGELRGTQYA